MSVRVVRWWCKVASQTPTSRGPMSPSGTAKILANGAVFCDLLANLHLHLEHKADLERVAEIRDL
jgi:hypothetical protein